MALATFGFCIARRRTCHTFFVALFGILIFFLGLIPIFAELTSLRAVSNLEQEDLDGYCALSSEEL